MRMPPVPCFSLLCRLHRSADLRCRRDRAAPHHERPAGARHHGRHLRHRAGRLFSRAEPDGAALCRVGLRRHFPRDVRAAAAGRPRGRPERAALRAARRSAACRARRSRACAARSGARPGPPRGWARASGKRSRAILRIVHLEGEADLGQDGDPKTVGDHLNDRRQAGGAEARHGARSTGGSSSASGRAGSGPPRAAAAAPRPAAAPVQSGRSASGCEAGTASTKRSSNRRSVSSSGCSSGSESTSTSRAPRCSSSTITAVWLSRSRSSSAGMRLLQAGSAAGSR